MVAGKTGGTSGIQRGQASWRSRRGWVLVGSLLLGLILGMTPIHAAFGQ